MDIKQAASAYNAIAGMAQNAMPTQTPPSDQMGTSFSELLASSLGSAVDKGHKAESVSTLAMMGKTDITNLATAVNSAELALNTVTAIRDKVITAYQQIAQMPI
jgi:flagellar hook-basal body complex protein FliE